MVKTYKNQVGGLGYFFPSKGQAHREMWFLSQETVIYNIVTNTTWLAN